MNYAEYGVPEPFAQVLDGLVVEMEAITTERQVLAERVARHGDRQRLLRELQLTSAVREVRQRLAAEKVA